MFNVGSLHLELDRATYERCGLPGSPISDLGRKHVKSRYGESVLMVFDQLTTSNALYVRYHADL